MLKQFFYTLLLILTLQNSGKVLEHIQPPELNNITQLDKNLKINIGEAFEYPYENLYNQYSRLFVQRNQPIETGIVTDYSKDSTLYQSINFCNLHDSHYMYTEDSSLKFQDFKPVSYAVDQAAQKVYLFTDSYKLISVSYTKTDVGEVKLSQNYVQISNELKDEKVIKMYMNPYSRILYLFTKTKLYSIKRGDQKVDVVQGYSQTNFSGRYEWNDTLLYVVRPEKQIVVYKVEEHSKVSILKVITVYNNQTVAPADINIYNHQLWVLDSNYGIYVYLRQGDIFTQYTDYSLRYGRKLFFKRLDNTIILNFQLNKQTYLVEIFLNIATLFVNRFYQQVSGIIDVELFDDMLFVVGQQFTMSIQHSINRKLLRKTQWQRKTFNITMGMTSIYKLQQQQTAKSVYNFVALEDNYLLFMKIRKYPAYISCYIQDTNLVGNHSFYVEMNSTSCQSQHNRKSRIRGISYCNFKHGINIQVVPYRQVMALKDVSYSPIYISLSGGVIVIGLFTYLMQNKKKEIIRMRQTLREKEQSSDQQVQGTIAQLNQKKKQIHQSTNKQQIKI